MAKYIISTEKLKKYLDFQISDAELFDCVDDDAANLGVEAEPESIVFLEKRHVKHMLELLLSGKISEDDAIDWGETMMLTFLYDWDDEANTDEEHDIVFNILQAVESMGEEGWELSREDLQGMYEEISKIC